MKEQPLDIASLMQIEDLKNANKVLDSMVNDLRAEVERLQAMQAARDAREQMQNDCIRLYVVRGADGRNYYGQTLQEAAKLALEVLRSARA